MIGAKRELGKIKDTFLGFEDHGLFSFFITFDFGTTVQAFAGYRLDQPSKDNRFRGTAFGCEVIMRILNAVGVDSWEKLVGQEMWAIREEGMIRGIEAPKYRKGTTPFHIRELIEAFEKREKVVDTHCPQCGMPQS